MNTDKIYAETLAIEYAPKDNSKVIALRKLDRKAKQPANIFAYAFGICAALSAAGGMCLYMQAIATGNTAAVSTGIIIGVIGLAAMSMNYPIYQRLLTKEKQKYAFEIIQLAREISDS